MTLAKKKSTVRAKPEPGPVKVRNIRKDAPIFNVTTGRYIFAGETGEVPSENAVTFEKLGYVEIIG